jgi:hypothetical protein
MDRKVEGKRITGIHTCRWEGGGNTYPYIKMVPEEFEDVE